MFSFFNKKLYIMDYDKNIGNLSEKLLHMLYYAKRNNKQIVFPRKKICFNFILKKLNYRQITSVYELESPYIYKNKVVNNILGVFFGCIYGLYLAYKSIMFVLKVNRPFKYSYFGIGQKNLFNTESLTSFSQESVDSIDWSKIYEEEVSIDLPRPIQKECVDNLKKLGVENKDWYVCLHIRTLHYGNESKEASFRISTPKNYEKAISYINSLGGKVIRLGDPIEMDIEADYIDYPNSKFKSGVMDLYLIKNCKFYIGTNSGILDTAFLFRKPVLAVNYSDFGFAKAYKSVDRILFTCIKDKESNELLTISEIFSKPLYINTNINDKYLKGFFKKYDIVENSSNEILLATMEMFKELEHPTLKNDLDKKFDKIVETTIKRWIKEEKVFFHENQGNLETAYRYSNRVYANGRVCRFQLENNLF